MFGNNTLIPMLAASDIERAKAFYEEKLDLKPVNDEGVLRYEVGDSAFEIYQTEFAGTNKATAATWYVDDVDGVVNTLKGRGVEFQHVELEDFEMENSVLTAPSGARAAWMIDSEGNILALIQPPS